MIVIPDPSDKYSGAGGGGGGGIGFYDPNTGSVASMDNAIWADFFASPTTPGAGGVEALPGEASNAYDSLAATGMFADPVGLPDLGGSDPGGANWADFPNSGPILAGGVAEEFGDLDYQLNQLKSGNDPYKSTDWGALGLEFGGLGTTGGDDGMGIAADPGGAPTYVSDGTAPGAVAAPSQLSDPNKFFSDTTCFYLDWGAAYLGIAALPQSWEPVGWVLGGAGVAVWATAKIGGC